MEQQILMLFRLQVAINWCICKGTIPIPGVKSVKQAEENLGALGWRLSSEELIQLEFAASESPRKMIQNIFQTRLVFSCFCASCHIGACSHIFFFFFDLQIDNIRTARLCLEY